MTIPRMTKKDKNESWSNFWKPPPFSPNIKYPSHSLEYEITKHIKTNQLHTLGVFLSFKKACTLVLEKCICLSINPLSLYLGLPFTSFFSKPRTLTWRPVPGIHCDPGHDNSLAPSPPATESVSKLHSSTTACCSLAFRGHIFWDITPCGIKLRLKLSLKFHPFLAYLPLIAASHPSLPL